MTLFIDPEKSVWFDGKFYRNKGINKEFISHEEAIKIIGEAARAQEKEELVEQIKLTQNIEFIPMADPMYHRGWYEALQSILDIIKEQ